MIDLDVKEIKRYLNLKSVIGSESDDYSKSMDDLISYLNQLARLKTYHIKRIKYFGLSEDTIKYKIVSTYGESGSYTITFDNSVRNQMQDVFFLSASSIKEILIYWINKFNKEDIRSIEFRENFTREVFVKLNTN